LTNTFIVVLSINHKTTQVNKTGGYLVVGAGLAGLSFALRVFEKNRVTVISKSELMDSNSSMAQGGIAAVQRLPDNFE
jgi:L-aspartate oxidase